MMRKLPMAHRLSSGIFQNRSFPKVRDIIRARQLRGYRIETGGVRHLIRCPLRCFFRAEELSWAKNRILP
jgi:hypothetical protein